MDESPITGSHRPSVGQTIGFCRLSSSQHDRPRNARSVLPTRMYKLKVRAISLRYGVGLLGGLFSAVERFTSILSPGITRAPGSVCGSPGLLANTIIAANGLAGSTEIEADANLGIVVVPSLLHL